MSTGREDLTESTKALENAIEHHRDGHDGSFRLGVANVLAIHALTKAVLDVGHATALQSSQKDAARLADKWEPPLSERKGFGQ